MSKPRPLNPAELLAALDRGTVVLAADELREVLAATLGQPILTATARRCARVLRADGDT